MYGTSLSQSAFYLSFFFLTFPALKKCGVVSAKNTRGTSLSIPLSRNSCGLFWGLRLCFCSCHSVLPSAPSISRFRFLSAWSSELALTRVSKIFLLARGRPCSSLRGWLLCAAPAAAALGAPCTSTTREHIIVTRTKLGNNTGEFAIFASIVGSDCCPLTGMFCSESSFSFFLVRFLSIVISWLILWNYYCYCQWCTIDREKG